MIKRKRPSKRSGIATVECALCLPIIMTLTVGVIETCGAIFLKESVTIAAYEGARVGARKSGTDAACESRIKQILDDRNITYDSENAVTVSGWDAAETLDHVTTTVTVPCRGNTVLGWFFGGQQIQASVVLRKEFKN